MVGIIGYGAYVPRLRLDRRAVAEANGWFNPGLKALAIGTRAMCNWDEDAVTMAVAASRDCLGIAPADTIQALHLASTTLPFVERSNAGIVAAALSLPESLATLDLTGSRRAATSALANALRGCRRGQPEAVLLVAAEKRRAKAGSQAEMMGGDAAASLLLGDGPGELASLIGTHQVSRDFVDQYRGRGEAAAFDYPWEERWIRDEGYLKIIAPAVTALLGQCGIAPAAVDHAVIPLAPRGAAESVAKAVGLKPEAVADRMSAEIGDAGVAHPLVMLADVLARATPGQTILCVGWGQGCDVLLFRATDRIGERRPRRGVRGHIAAGRIEKCYTRYLAFNGLIEQDRGLRSEVDKQTALSALYRNRGTLTSLAAGRCRLCGTVQFPAAEVCVNPDCGAFHSQEDHPLADVPATIASWTADNLTYTPDPPQHFGLIAFADGARMMADITDVDPGDVRVGLPVRMEFRIKDVDDRRGFTRYFWKAVPDRSGESPHHAAQ